MEAYPGLMVTDGVRLSRMLGKGGMGAVWLADHLTLRTHVAVKLMFDDLVRRDPTVRVRPLVGAGYLGIAGEM